MESTETEQPVTEARPAPAPPVRDAQYQAIGRRKTSVARVYLRPGSGAWMVNGRSLEQHLPRHVLRQSAIRPLVATETEGQFDVKVTVKGGGLRGQADAIRLGVARALLKVDEDFRRRLRTESLLTRDPREVERKKPGRPGARKRFQFSKR
ncbi:MAG: 30S ribosomal protein S9 [Gemmatimonadota bacterium]|nr:30S ribosomal protein S9 [Gemmatimonadota bacterium]